MKRYKSQSCDTCKNKDKLLNCACVKDYKGRNYGHSEYKKDCKEDRYESY